jgi:hypothetical protein
VNQQLSDLHSLPVQRAFVVQLGAATVVGQQRFLGRVEHVISGQAAHFATLEELLAFMARVLAAQTSVPEVPP